MAGINGRISSCSFLSTSDVESCKLPLLDGETSGSSEIIRTNVELDREVFSDLCRCHGLRLRSLLCTAWALVLRCYTGQDRATFEYITEDSHTVAPSLRMILDQDETLSSHTENAQNAIAEFQRNATAMKQANAASVGIDALSHAVNTAIVFSNSDAQAGALTAKKIRETVSVSNNNCSRYLLCIYSSFD